ncbi:hypothetical protein [Streptacidiphilus neutrinimicus]|uniref:hypothetical protein n=1 Tax=Streptacidiphilus neutrinimicus TaxID=105420 RepID=UPI0005A9515C|nr:hypothetical protein [Streptacidiphilus neutrinimicus]
MDDFQQGDIVESVRLPVQGANGQEVWIETPQGVALITQTCDIVVDTKHFVQVAPLVHLEGNEARQASKGAVPGRVGVPGAGDGVFADLEHVATVDKRYIATFAPKRGALTTMELKRFGARVGRKFSRFAFPDDINYWLQSLKGVVLDKVGNANSDLGLVLDEMVESLRLECDPSWDSSAPWRLTLVVIVRPDLLPILDDVEPMEPSTGVSSWLYQADGETLRRSAAEIATKLLALPADAPAGERMWWWDAFGHALAAACRVKSGAPDSARDAVVGGGFAWEVLTAEEFTYERFLRSEEIDLDHLSAPLPR